MPSECDFSHLSGASLLIEIVHHGMTDDSLKTPIAASSSDVTAYPRIVNLYESVAYHYFKLPYLQKKNEGVAIRHSAACVLIYKTHT